MDYLGIHTQGDLTLHHECTQRVFLLCLREHGLYSLSFPNASLMHHILSSSALLLVKERSKWTLSNSPPSRNGNHLPLLREFDSSWVLQFFIINSSQISLMLLPHSTSSPGKTNLGLGSLSNSMCLKHSRMPSPQDLFFSFLTLPNHSQL